MGSKDQPHSLRDRNDGLREIFLFSNGQTDSPPRKYSVSVNEPWDATLKRISIAQQGSKHMIELYTIEGNKIGGPLELSDGAAYVAVEPPQQLVPAGYRDYLMKASRSREKRQERKPEINFSSKPVQIDSKEKLSEAIEGTPHFQDPIQLPCNLTVAKDQNAITDKVAPGTDRNVKTIKRTCVLKATQNKHNIISKPHSFMTKNVTNDKDVPSNKKIRSTNKVDAIKKKFETNGTKNKIIPTKNNSTVAENKSAPTKNNSTVTQNKIAPTKNNSTVTENKFAPTKNNSMVTKITETMFKREENDSTAITKEPNNMQIEESLSKQNIPRLYAQRNLTLDSSRTAPNAPSTVILPVRDNYDKNLRGSEFIDLHNPSMPAVSDLNLHAADHKDLCKTESNSNITTDARNQFTQTKTAFMSSQIGAAENNLIINVEQGNLKLDIRFRNESNSNYVNTTKSVLKSPESPSQDTDVPVAKNDQEAPTLTHVELSFEQIHHIANHRKAAVHQYFCGSNCGNTEPFVLVNVHNNETGFILLPLRKHNEVNERCCSELEFNLQSEVQENQSLPRQKNNVEQTDEIKFVPNVSEQGNPIEGKQTPPDTEQFYHIKMVPELPEQNNPTQSNRSTKESSIQLNEITIVPNVSEKEPTTDDIKIVPEHPVPGNSTQSKPIITDNTTQSDETKFLPELPDQGNSQSRTKSRDNIAQSDDNKIVPEVSEKINGLINNLIPKDQSKRVSILEVTKTCDCCETCTLQNKTTGCSCGATHLLPSPVSGDELPITTSLVLDPRTPVTSVSTFRDAFTQTAWNGTVLEARPREDGTYEFHMPALETLKRYNAL